METQKFSESFETLSDHLKEYVNLRVDLVKLILVEKMARLASLLLLIIFALILLIFAGVFLGFAFVLWYGSFAGPMWAGALIVAGIIILTGILLLIFRKRFLLNAAISQLSQIIMEEPGNGEE